MPETITSYHSFSAGTKARSSQVNTNFSNYRGTSLPIDPTSTAAANNSYNLGSSEYYWKRAYIRSGQWAPGDIKAHMNYNAAISSPGHGWMKCDGRVISEANYNTEHGTSTAWSTFVGSSPLDGKFLPNMTNKFLVGDTVTAQTGAATLTSIGNAGNTINIQHSHSIPSHNHKWYQNNGAGTTAYTYDAAGNTINWSTGQVMNPGTGANAIVTADGGSPTITGQNFDAYTANVGLTSTLTGSATQSIMPESIKVIYYMRIID